MAQIIIFAADISFKVHSIRGPRVSLGLKLVFRSIASDFRSYKSIVGRSRQIRREVILSLLAQNLVRCSGRVCFSSSKMMTGGTRRNQLARECAMCLAHAVTRFLISIAERPGLVFTY